MPGPYPLATLSVTIDENGATAPPYEDILASLQQSYRNIYGSDVDLAADAQDGQWLAVQAQAIHDCNQSVIAGYLSYSPATAQGIGLSNVVKINALRRLAPSNSSVELLLVGQVGRQILNGVAADLYRQSWLLPSEVTIPVEGEILVTAVAAAPGAILAAPGTVTIIATPTPGWQSVTNPESAFAGDPVEGDATLRRRQTRSTALPSITPAEGIDAAIANLAGVGRSHVYDNDNDFYDQNLVPPHSIAVVVEAGDVEQIATVISRKKNVGAGTYGTTQFVVIDDRGVPNAINFFFLTEQTIWVGIAIEPLPGYLATTGELIVAAVVEAISSLPIGENVIAPRLQGPADLAGTAALTATGLPQTQLDRLSATYVVRQITLGTAAGQLGAADIMVPFQSAAACNVSNVTLSQVQVR